MTQREAHTLYANKLAEISDARGKAISDALIAHLRILLARAGENPAAFLDLTTRSRDFFVAVIRKRGGDSYREAVAEGKHFGQLRGGRKGVEKDAVSV